MTESVVVKNLITTHDQTLRTVFSAHRSYFIDIYQREYKWTEENVKTLLGDIEVRFLQNDLKKSNPKDIREDVLQRFEPYFLNTYLTHTTAAHKSIVDGQQRLTTLLLILIKLYQVLKAIAANPANTGKTFVPKTLEQLIFETNDFGELEKFKIYNANREDAFRAIIEGQSLDARDETRQRIKENFQTVSDYFDKFLLAPDISFNVPKLTYYICYLLDRVSIVEIQIEKQDNVAMIFEVVNDRGLGLKPYEILKGKLIGALPLSQKEQANLVWTELQDKYYRTTLVNTSEKTIDLDSFFRTFFRAKFADSETDYEKFEGDYHYEIYRNEAIRRYFQNFQDRDLLFKRIMEDIRYFADLYLNLRTSYDEEYLIYNKLLDQNQQYLLLLSNIKFNDVDEKAKIHNVAKKFDQIHVLLRLLDAYDSNEFQRLIYPLSQNIRDANISEAMGKFDQAAIGALEKAEVITPGQHRRAHELFEYERFKGVANKWVNFSKYILMRIDRFLAQTLDKPSFSSADLSELESRFNRTGNKRHGMHLEHIYTQHPTNKALFTRDNSFDESEFQRTRNLLGMVLLLKDKHNLSSNNEIYRDKITTYTKSNLIWNELLVGHLPRTDYANLPADLKISKIEPEKSGAFPLSMVESRQAAIFAAIKTLWDFS